MLRETSCLGKYLLTVIVLLAVLALPAHAPAADGKPPTVSILNPRPGTAAAPTIVSLRPQSNDFKVQVQVWDDGAITANSVQIGYYAGATPDSGTFTFVPAALNANYACGTNCGIYEAVIGGLTPNTTYYLYARATSGDGTGESRQNRTGNDARYLAIRIVAARTGTGMLLVRDSSSQFCLDCHNLPSHSSQATGTTYGNWQTVCLDCHTAHTTRNLFLVKESVITPNSGTRAVTFYKTTGDAVNSYATASLGAATRGICQVCHTQTKNPVTLVSRWTNAGNADASHYQSPKPNSARCTDCHNHTAGFANTAGDCKDCHSISQGGRRPVLGPGGDFAGNTSIASRHVGGAVDPTPAQCLVCHDLSRHTQGTVRLRHGDTGSVNAYNPLQPSTLEPFCLSCHDANGAGGDMSPFGDGATLGAVPFVAGTTIASSWSGSSAHRSRGLTCAGNGSVRTGCHGSGGSINMHGSTVKGMLTNTMNFQIPLVSTAVYSADPLGSSWSYANYKLCFDCHANYPAATKEVVLGYKAGGVYDQKKAPTPYYTLGMQSLFRERYLENPANYPPAWGGIDQLYNDTLWSDRYLALHNYHLIGFLANALSADPTANMLQWNYRGDPARVGRITCTACHNVHGTTVPTIRSTHAELGLQRDYPIFPGYGPFPGESYTSIDPLINETIMGSHPMNCAVDCHGLKGQSSYWHTPNGDPETTPVLDCRNCHSAALGIRRPVLGAGGDFAGNPSIASRHVGGATDPTPAQCLVCHDLSRHTQGTVRLRHGDTGSVSAYDPLQPSALEPFCLSCHDGNGAGGNMSPFGDGATLGSVPYVAGATIASSWTGSATHRSKGLTCAGTGSPATGCHGNSGAINMHGSTVKGMLTNTMNFQIPLVSAAVYSADPLGSSWSYANYQLCFDCHANYPAATKEVVLGYRRNGVYDNKNSPTPYYTLGMQSLFREHYIGPDPLRPYSDTIGGDTYLALHNYHLIGFEGNVLASDPSANMLQWNYRGDPARVGRITCTACHNVHGTIAATIRNTHQELGLVRDYYSIAFGFSSQPGESYTSIDSLIDATKMGSHPMNCAVICHQGSSGILTQSYWHTPNGD